MSDFRTRMLQEWDDLCMRLEKLKTFILSPAYDALPEIDRTDLKEQLVHMQGYRDVLSRRVSRQCSSA